MFNKSCNRYEASNRFAIKKYHFGAASVLLGAVLILGNGVVSADEAVAVSDTEAVVMVLPDTVMADASQPEVRDESEMDSSMLQLVALKDEEVVTGQSHVIVHYIGEGEDGVASHLVKPEIKTGTIGEVYQTEAKVIPGHILLADSKNTSGTYLTDDSYVTYVYQKLGAFVPVIPDGVDLAEELKQPIPYPNHPTDPQKAGHPSTDAKRVLPEIEEHEPLVDGQVLPKAPIGYHLPELPGDVTKDTQVIYTPIAQPKVEEQQEKPLEKPQVKPEQSRPKKRLTKCALRRLQRLRKQKEQEMAEKAPKERMLEENGVFPKQPLTEEVPPKVEKSAPNMEMTDKMVEQPKPESGTAHPETTPKVEPLLMGNAQAEKPQSGPNKSEEATEEKRAEQPQRDQMKFLFKGFSETESPKRGSGEKMPQTKKALPETREALPELKLPDQEMMTEKATPQVSPKTDQQEESGLSAQSKSDNKSKGQDDKVMTPEMPKAEGERKGMSPSKMNLMIREMPPRQDLAKPKEESLEQTPMAEKNTNDLTHTDTKESEGQSRMAGRASKMEAPKGMTKRSDEGPIRTPHMAQKEQLSLPTSNRSAKHSPTTSLPRTGEATSRWLTGLGLSLVAGLLTSKQSKRREEKSSD